MENTKTEDPVLAELDRRIALAEAATPGPWHALYLANHQFLADAGTNRLAELRALKAAWELLRATNEDCSEDCPCCYIEGIFERAILGEDNDR